MEDYGNMKSRHSKEFEKLQIFFAFNNKQLNEGMLKIGLKITDIDKIYKLAGGGFYKKEDSHILNDLFTRHNKEMNNAVESDTTGEGFIFNMFCHELSNHEYCYTWDDTDALEALGFTHKDVEENKALANGLRLAKIEQSNEG